MTTDIDVASRVLVEGLPHRRFAAMRRRLFPVVYFVRYGLVGWTALLVSVVEAAIMSQRGAQWRGDLLWTIDWQPVSFVIVGPIVAGAAAMDTARTAIGARHFFGNPVLRTPAFAIARAYAVVLGLVHCAVLIGALALSVPPVGDAFAPLAVLCQVLMIALFATIGTVVGRFVGPVLAGLVAALAAFALIYIAGAPTKHVSVLDLGGLPTIPRIGYAYNPVFLGVQAVFLLMVIAALLTLRPVEGGRRQTVERRDVLIAAVVLLAVVTGSLTVRSERLQEVTSEPTYCGAAVAVPTCFYPQHQRVARAFTEQLWALVVAAQDKGYEALLPTRVLEASRTQLPQEGDPQVAAFFVMPEHLQGSKPTLWEIASGIVQPVHCPQLRRDQAPSERYWSDLQALTGTWVALADRAEAENQGFTGPPLPPDQAAALLQAFRTCTYPYF